MPTAVVLLRSTPSYRPELFREGLRRVGYKLLDRALREPTPEDVLVVWNRRPSDGFHIRTYEKAGARIVVAENGYIGHLKDDSRKVFALALGHHNGAGTWPHCNGIATALPSRWSRFGVELEPWRKDGDFLLILPQRGIGEPGVAMPRFWGQDLMTRLRRSTRRPIRIRRHPGPTKSEPYEDLRGAWAAVTWGSGAAIKALAAGIPVFHELPPWIGAPAARLGVETIEEPFLEDRTPMFDRLAWAQWSAREIESGEAFAWLLDRPTS